MGRPHRQGTQETTPIAVRLTKDETAELKALCAKIGRLRGENPPSRSVVLRAAFVVLYELIDDEHVRRTLDMALDVDGA